MHKKKKKLKRSLAFTNVLSKMQNKDSSKVPSYSWTKLYKEAPKTHLKIQHKFKTKTYFKIGLACVKNITLRS